MYFIEADHGKERFEFYQYDKPRVVNDKWEGKMIKIKMSGNLDQKPWHNLYFNLEGKLNRITDTNVPELKKYINK